MPAKELTERLTVPRDVEGWTDLSLEERYQREINYRRVKDQIAPYLVNEESRFFGAFIVTMLNSEQVEFEPMARIYKEKVPTLYRSAADAFGFLTIQGSEVLVPLDGQHRLAALEFAITGKDEKQQPISDIEASAKVASDICTVMLIKDHEVDSRTIFNKVNRYAKATSKAENLITADDDIVAVIVRSALVGMDNIIPEPLVNVKSNTLSTKAGEFTTLATLYESTKYVLENTHGRINTQRLPDKSVQGLMRSEATEFWETVCSSISLFDVALRDPSETGNEKRQQIRADYLLGKPFAQWALVQALVQLCNEDAETGARMSLSEACNRANQLTWRVDDRRWQQVLMNGDRVLFGKSAVNFAARVIAYWLGQPLNDAAVADLRSTYENQGGTRPLAEPIL
jgi:DNA sulfur modification protein DndB